MAVNGGMCVRELAVAHTVPVSGFVYVFIFLSRVKNSPDVTKRHRLNVVFVLALRAEVTPGSTGASRRDLNQNISVGNLKIEKSSKMADFGKLRPRALVYLVQFLVTVGSIRALRVKR